MQRQASVLLPYFNPANAKTAAKGRCAVVSKNSISKITIMIIEQTAVPTVWDKAPARGIRPHQLIGNAVHHVVGTINAKISVPLCSV